MAGPKKCPFCSYSAMTAGSLAGHISMLAGKDPRHPAPGALPNQTTVYTDGTPTSMIPPEDRPAVPYIDPTPTDLGEATVTMIPVDDPPLVPPATREAWMLRAVEAMRPRIAEVGAPVGPIRISFGWPGGRGNKQNVRGQCWMPEAVKDAVPAIFVSPAMEAEDTLTLLGIILHEMNHAAGHFGHRGPFAKTAEKLGFLKPWTSSENKSDELRDFLAEVAETLGPLDHGAISAGHGLKGTGITAPPVQSTRMRKLACQLCGYTVRSTMKWISVGLPTCYCGGAFDVA